MKRTPPSRQIIAAALESLEVRQLLSAGDVNFGPSVAPVSGFQFDYRVGLTTQPDGKILVAGYVDNGITGRDIAVARYSSAGVLDTSYGSGGVAVLQITGDQEAKSIILDPTGRAVLAGTTDSPHTSFAVARLTDTGAADTTFDTDGLAFADFGAANDSYGWAVASQPDGKIVVGGTAFIAASSRYEFALARFASNGALDNSFDGDGKRTHNVIAGNSDQITDLVLQPDGKIVVSGTSNATLTNAGNKFILARYNTNGSNDAGFGTSGVAQVSFAAGTTAAASGLALQSNGRIVAIGSVTASGGSESIGVVRYTAAGLPDSSFDGDGKMTFSFGSTDRPGAVAMQTIGGTQRIVVSASTGSSGNIAVARIDLNGALDTAFSGDGKVATSVTGGVERVPALIVQDLASPFGSNLIAAGVNTANEIVFASYDANSAATTGGQPDVDYVSDEWTITQDKGLFGLSMGDVVTAEGVTAVFGIDGFDTIQDALDGVSSVGRSVVLAGSDNVLVSDAFTVAGNRKLDVLDNRLVLHSADVGSWNGSAYTGVSGLIASGFANDTWTGRGIMTSDTRTARGVGVASAADVLGLAPGESGVWFGQLVDAEDTLVMFTYGGDSSMDGFVSGDDYSHIDFSILVGGRSGWYDGDYNWDGIVTGDDYSTIDFAILAQGAPIA